MKLFTSWLVVIVNIYRYYIGSTNGEVSYKTNMASVTGLIYV